MNAASFDDLIKAYEKVFNSEIEGQCKRQIGLMVLDTMKVRGAKLKDLKKIELLVDGIAVETRKRPAEDVEAMYNLQKPKIDGPARFFNRGEGL